VCPSTGLVYPNDRAMIPHQQLVDPGHRFAQKKWGIAVPSPPPVPDGEPPPVGGGHDKHVGLRRLARTFRDMLRTPEVSDIIGLVHFQAGLSSEGEVTAWLLLCFLAPDNGCPYEGGLYFVTMVSPCSSPLFGAQFLYPAPSQSMCITSGYWPVAGVPGDWWVSAPLVAGVRLQLPLLPPCGAHPEPHLPPQYPRHGGDRRGP
jgi:hypothetical protein